MREAERQAEREQRESEVANEEYEDQNVDESPEERKKRKRKEAATLAKIKQSKEFARRKARGHDGDDDDEIARNMMHQKSKPLPGQLDNCEICEKRFAVTPYSKTGPNGGLLCAQCSKQLTNDEKKAKQKKSAPQKRSSPESKQATRWHGPTRGS